MKKNDNVNHPSHYADGNIEVIDFIEDKNLGFHLGNAIKYICRAGKKDKEKTKEDIEKAIWYLNRFLKGKNERTREDFGADYENVIAWQPLPKQYKPKKPEPDRAQEFEDFWHDK